MKYTCSRCSTTRFFKSKRSYEKNVAQGCCSPCLTIGAWKCLRCETVIKYRSRRAFVKATKNNSCRKCDGIPDSELENFKKGIFSKHCPKCSSLQIYSSRKIVLAAIRLNTICIFCANKQLPVVMKKYFDNCTSSQRAKWIENSKKDIQRKNLNC